MPAENGMPENEDVKKKALLRLAVAGIVTAAALGGLWWLDQDGSDQKKAAPKTSAPAPIIAAPSPEVQAPEPETPANPSEDTPPAQELSAPAPSPTPNRPVSPPSPRSVEAPPPPPRVSNAPRTPTATPPQAQQTAPQPLPKPAAAEPQPRPGASQGYVVQVGVFSNPDNARELVEKLNKQGVRAHLEARVQIGPFLNRQEAEKAQAAMRKLGYNALVTLPYSALPATK
jgi:DedD protein